MNVQLGPFDGSAPYPSPGSVVAIVWPDEAVEFGTIEEKIAGGLFAVRCADQGGSASVGVFRLDELRRISCT
jgi:hypothetical protein